MLLEILLVLHATSGACTHVPVPIQKQMLEGSLPFHDKNDGGIPLQNISKAWNSSQVQNIRGSVLRNSVVAHNVSDSNLMWTNVPGPLEPLNVSVQPVSFWDDLHTVMFAAHGRIRNQSIIRLRKDLDRIKITMLKKEEYKLFQEKDMWMWITFAIIFVVLILFDNLVLHRSHEALSLTRALIYTAFWMFCGFLWGVAIYFHRGTNDAIDWATAYMLEWMLSIDCLFFFHIIFKIFSTPDHLKHKPLFYGICGAIVFRMIFFSIEEVIMHSSIWAHVIFGLFLVYTGIKSATMGDEHFDPRENKIFVFICQYTPLLNGYHDNGYFFVKVPVDAKTGKPLIELQQSPRRFVDYTSTPQNRRANFHRSDSADSNVSNVTDRSTASSEKPPPVYTDEDIEDSIGMMTPRRYYYKWLATLLLMVVLCLEVTDLIFAVDSVSAIVAEVPDLFIAYTASVFAMLGLRAMFFVTDELMHLFVLLKYGIAAILVVIGIKLILSHWIEIHPLIMLAVLMGIFASSILGSLCLNAYQKYEQHSARRESQSSTPGRKTPDPENSRAD